LHQKPISISSMSYSQSNLSVKAAVEADLNRLARFGVDLSLDRIEKLLASLGNPHEQVPIVHVAGTNGKGSVCAYLASILMAAGYRTGRYTSPHLVNWTERICVDGVPISWRDLHDELQGAIALIDSQNPIPTQFEVFTAVAWQYFARQRVDVAVVEVGLGGRLDATNLCRPLATVIVSIGRDHWERLGNTLAEIAGEKAGILKPAVPAIAGPLPPEAAAVVRARAAVLNAPLTWVTAAEEVSSQVSSSESSPMLSYEGIHYPQVLLGPHQLINSACAIATVQSLRTQGWAISDEAIVAGMAQVRWPGRLQKSQWQGHSLLIDGAHNQEAARSLRAYVDKTYHQPVTWLIGMLDTKDHAGVFSELLRSGDRLYLVPVPGHLSAELEDLCAIAQKVCPNLAHLESHLNLEAALSAATQGHPQGSQADSIILCGSLYLIGEFYERYGLP
jgi:dihydrofolate synthase / folylpolyglutamate synthase